MKRYKKIASLLLALIVIFSIAGCGGDTESTGNEPVKKIVAKENTKQKEKKVEEAAPEEQVSGNGQPAALAVPAAEQPAVKTEIKSNQPTTNNTQSVSQPQTNDPGQGQQAPPPTPVPVDSVTISIIGYNGKQVLSPSKVNIKVGDTVMNVLLKTGKMVETNVPGTYVEGIEDDYEFDHGPGSGWIYKLNGEIKGDGAKAVEVKDGDQIVWTYKEG